MSSTYPTTVDTFDTVQQCTGEVTHTWMNKIQDCVVAIETFIGTGTLATTATTIVTAINEIVGDIGDIDQLATVASTIVAAINEHERQINLGLSKFDRRQAIPELAFSFGLELHRSHTRSYTVGEEPYAGVYDGSSLWVTCSQSSTLTKFDPASERRLDPVQTTITVDPVPRGICYEFDSDSIWVACSNSVIRINPSTNATVATLTSHDGDTFSNLTDILVAVTIEDGVSTKYIFVVDRGNSRIVQIDIATNTTINAVSVGVNPQHMIYDGYYLWVTHTSLTQVTRIDIYSSSIAFATSTLSVPYATNAIVFDGENIWVGVVPNSKLYKYNVGASYGPTSFTEVMELTDPVLTVTGELRITDLLCDGKYIWASVRLGTDLGRIFKIDVGHPLDATPYECKVLQTWTIDNEPTGLAYDGLSIYALSSEADTVQKILTVVQGGVSRHDHSGYGEGGSALSHALVAASTVLGHIRVASGEVSIGIDDEASIDITSYGFTSRPLVSVMVGSTGGGAYTTEQLGYDVSENSYYWYSPDPGTSYFVIVNKFDTNKSFKWWAIGT